MIEDRGLTAGRPGGGVGLSELNLQAVWRLDLMAAADRSKRLSACKC